MALHFLSPEAAMRALELAKNPYRPKVIVELTEQIEAEKRAAELSVTVTGAIDMERVHKIVAMKLRLDGLYAQWAEGKIE